MRWIVAALALLSMGATAQAEDQVWLVSCRIWNSIPRIGVLHHECITICDSRERPFYEVTPGRKLGNPTLTYWGTRPGTPGFSQEAPPLVEVTARRIDVPADVVRQRLAEHKGTWTLVSNCQVAARWAVNPPGKWSLTSYVLKK